MGGARVFELVAERRAEEVVDVVGPGEVEGVRGIAHGGGELAGESFAEDLDLVGRLVLVAVVAMGELHLRGRVLRRRDAGDAAAAQVGWRVDICWTTVQGVGRPVECAETFFCLGQVAVVEGVRVHLHEHHHGVQEQEHLGCPCPLQDKGYSDPEG